MCGYVTMRPESLRTVLVGALVLFSACAVGEREIVPLTEVRQETFEVRIPAFGELKAAKTTMIETPPTLRGIQRIAWIAS